MEIINQRVSFAEITHYDNYCNIEDKELFLMNNDFERSAETVAISTPSFNNKKRIKSRTFFDTNNQLILVKSSPTIYTTDDEYIKKHYPEPFSKVVNKIYNQRIIIENDILKINYYFGVKCRYTNSRYFKTIKKICNNISFNLKTGNFTTSINKGVIKRNKFSELNYIINFISSNNLDHRIPNDDLSINQSRDVINDIMIKTFDNNLFTNALCDILKIPYYEQTCKNDLYNAFINLFIKLKNIKVPDNMDRELLTKFYPTEKYLKKNDRKLLASILDMLSIKSKFTIALLHKHQNINLGILTGFCYLFGPEYPKYLASIKPEWFEILLCDNDQYTISHKQSILVFKSDFMLDLTNEDREDIVRLLNNVEKNKFIGSRMVCDHYNMILRIREYEPNTRLRAKTFKQFNDEHTYLSELSNQIRKGWTTEYIFNADMVNEVEKPIVIDFGDKIIGKYTPHILKREDEYQEEGRYMHHCVATYIDRRNSVIISLRRSDNNDRVTCEFSAQNGECIQARSFYNVDPTDDFLLVIDELKKRVKYYAKRGMMHSLSEKRTPLRINGIEVVPPKVVPTIDLDDLFPEF